MDGRMRSIAYQEGSFTLVMAPKARRVYDYRRLHKRTTTASAAMAATMFITPAIVLNPITSFFTTTIITISLVGKLLKVL